MEVRTDYSQIKFQNNGKLKLLIIVGTRSGHYSFAAVINKCRHYFDTLLAHTGQNYDYNLNGVFFRDLKLKDPEVYMDAVGDDLGATMGNIINASYKLMAQTQPDAVLVLGDTNSCLSVIGAKRLHIPNLPHGRPVTAAKTNACRKRRIVLLWILSRMSMSVTPNMLVVIWQTVDCLKSEPTYPVHLWQRCYMKT